MGGNYENNKKSRLYFSYYIINSYIYITNKDTKVYYVSLGDGISRGINENDIEGYGYSDYVKDYLNKINKLEFYTKKFSGIDYRTTDIINNIEDNIEIIQNNKKITIKNECRCYNLIYRIKWNTL